MSFQEGKLWAELYFAQNWHSDFLWNRPPDDVFERSLCQTDIKHMIKPTVMNIVGEAPNQHQIDQIDKASFIQRTIHGYGTAEQAAIERSKYNLNKHQELIIKRAPEAQFTR